MLNANPLKHVTIGLGHWSLLWYPEDHVFVLFYSNFMSCIVTVNVIHFRQFVSRDKIKAHLILIGSYIVGQNL